MRRLCIITGSRAEWGLLSPLAGQIRRESRSFRLQIMATCMHLSPKFGNTYREIERDGFKIDAKVKMPLPGDSHGSMADSVGAGVRGISRALKRLKPDAVIILGDRFEAFSAAVASYLMRTPIVHIHGGELTEGSIDEAFRHSITKMASLHLTSTEAYRKRVIQMGEHPRSVYNVGALGIDNIKRLSLLSKPDLEERLNFRFNRYNFLVTFHPAASDKDISRKQFQELLRAIDGIEHASFIFTNANADPGGSMINKMIDRFSKRRPGRVSVYTSMGQTNYLSTMRFVDSVIGNSSSGIIEAPSFKIGAINIGDRQKGRIKPESVIDCGPTKTCIRDAIRKLYSKEFQKSLKHVVNPYGDGNTAKRIKDILKKYDLSTVSKKCFYDIDFSIMRNV